MLMIQPRFVLLVGATWLAFFGVPSRFRSHVLTAGGVGFYALYAPSTLWLVAALVVLTYLAGGTRARWMVVGVLVGLLAYFKWPSGGISAVSAGIIDVRAGGAIVPLGFSFLSFELIHYAIERGRGRIRDTSLVDLAAFAFFFPCRIAGPIKRYSDFTASVLRAERSPDDVYRGGLRILSGLLKKVVLADRLDRLSSTIPLTGTPLQAWAAMAAYALVLYLDFSAYSDIAIGVSRLMGLRVPENFRWPYLSSNIQDFWNRWHMSLSSWARDYIFMGVGRQLFKTRWKRQPQAIAAASYMATFLVIGAWHGLTLNFLVWGAYHGLLVTAFHVYKTTLPVSVATSRFYQSRFIVWAGIGFTFLQVTIGWVFFRMDVPHAVGLLRLMLGG
jgi:alginate O-acetyltransferase complex protein AlgI